MRALALSLFILLSLHDQANAAQAAPPLKPAILIFYKKTGSEFPWNEASLLHQKLGLKISHRMKNLGADRIEVKKDPEKICESYKAQAFVKSCYKEEPLRPSTEEDACSLPQAFPELESTLAAATNVTEQLHCPLIADIGRRKRDLLPWSFTTLRR